MKKTLLLCLISANLIGALYGFIFFYGDQLVEVFKTKAWLLLFVPDCPLFALLMAISFGLLLVNKKNNFLFFLSSAGAMKYGFWTIFILTAFPKYYFSQNTLLYSILLIAHIGLFFEAFLLLRNIEIKTWHFSLVLLFLLFNEIADYSFGTKPPMPKQAVELMLYVTLLASITFTLTVVFLSKKLKIK